MELNPRSAPARLLSLRQVLHNNAQLRAFLVQMTTLQAKSLRGLGDMPAMAFEFCQHSFSFKSKYPLRQRSRCCVCAGLLWLTAAHRWQRHAHVFRVHFSFRQKEQALHNVSQLANISGPSVLFQFFNRLRTEGRRSPTILRTYLAREMLD